MSDNSLSEVFNIRGGNNINNINDYTISNSEINPTSIYNDSGERQYITVDEDTNCIHGGKLLENAKGVVRFTSSDDPNNEYIYYIQILWNWRSLDEFKSSIYGYSCIQCTNIRYQFLLQY